MLGAGAEAGRHDRLLQDPAQETSFLRDLARAESSVMSSARPSPIAVRRGTPLDLLTQALLDAYGPQGWWPLLGHAGANPTSTGRLTGYHPGDFTFPRTPAQAFEIGCGAILTQNTAWTNVERALHALAGRELLGPAAILSAPDAVLE